MAQQIFATADELAAHLRDHAPQRVVITGITPKPTLRGAVATYVNTAQAAAKSTVADDFHLDIDLLQEATPPRLANAIAKAQTNTRFR